MHADSTRFEGLTQKESYEQLLLQLDGLLIDNWVANLANASSLIWHHFHAQPSTQNQVNWAGFYVLNPKKNNLVLGPFQGKVACQEIDIGKGVCGTAAKENKTQLVPDVHEFPGHIACDGDTNSEIVVPITKDDGTVVGVIDIDCLAPNGFNETDKYFLERVAKLLAPTL